MYLDIGGKWEELLIHDFVPGREQVHKFETVNARRLRVEFLECKKEQYGCYEPIVNTLSVYCQE